MIIKKLYVYLFLSLIALPGGLIAMQPGHEQSEQQESGSMLSRLVSRVFAGIQPSSSSSSSSSSSASSSSSGALAEESTSSTPFPYALAPYTQAYHCLNQMEFMQGLLDQDAQMALVLAQQLAQELDQPKSTPRNSGRNRKRSTRTSSEIEDAPVIKDARTNVSSQDNGGDVPQLLTPSEVEEAAVSSSSSTSVASEVQQEKPEEKPALPDHGTHCGYYAVFNALSFLLAPNDVQLQEDIENRELFQNAYLNGWEDVVRAHNGQDYLGPINNLTPEELEAVVATLDEDLRNHIGVIDQADHALTQWSQGQVFQILDEMLDKVERLNQGDKIALLLNTNGHWITVGAEKIAGDLRLHYFDSIKPQGQPEGAAAAVQEYRQNLVNNLYLFLRDAHARRLRFAREFHEPFNIINRTFNCGIRYSDEYCARLRGIALDQLNTIEARAQTDENGFRYCPVTRIDDSETVIYFHDRVNPETNVRVARLTSLRRQVEDRCVFSRQTGLTDQVMGDEAYGKFLENLIRLFSRHVGPNIIFQEAMADRWNNPKVAFNNAFERLQGLWEQYSVQLSMEQFIALAQANNVHDDLLDAFEARNIAVAQ
ncbi:hypothetical protein K2W90_03645 [Candidatus Babeliales bacterium]|nr:hypothetical protein [Candidatus Babeliales bacterium]